MSALTLQPSTPGSPGHNDVWRRRIATLMLLAALSAYYLLLLGNGSLSVFVPEAFGRVYGSMLQNLLQGEFTVARTAIGSEAFIRDGKTYAYFGVFPALLRLPTLAFVDLRQTELARLSCLVAIVLFVALQLRTLRVFQQSLPERARHPALHGLMAAGIVLSGPQLYLLSSSSIFHEAVFWAAALGASFNLVVVRAVFSKQSLSLRDLCLLALVAGCALHTRPSVGVALCSGAGLLVLWSVLVQRSVVHGGPVDAPSDRHVLRPLAAIFGDARLYAPLLVLAAFAAASGWINYERWGNPLKFADFRYYEIALRRPHRLKVILDYGEVNPGRIWISSLYYATGIPYVLKSIPPVAEFLRARFDGLEGPPNSGLLTNPLTVLFAIYGLVRLVRRPDLPRGTVAILRITLVGHAAAILVLLSAMYLALRYRFDFAPFMTLAAFVGYYSFCLRMPALSPKLQARWRNGIAALCVAGILMSHCVLVFYKVTDFTVPEEVRRALFPLTRFARTALEK